MADVVIVRFRVGSGDEGVALYDKAHPKIMPLAKEKYPGLLNHTCAKTDDGIVVVDVWEDAAQWQALFADPEVVEGLKALGVGEPEVQIYPVHNQEVMAAV
jgi:quinol monooxygenase YgiN